jgi:hypothetical protein
MPDEGTGRYFGRLWLWGVFSLVTFFWTSKRKWLASKGKTQR